MLPPLFLKFANASCPGVSINNSPEISIVNPNKHFKEYITPGTDRYNAMVEVLRSESGLDSVNFQTLENIIKASGMKKEDLCTHCFDGSGYF